MNLLDVFRDEQLAAQSSDMAQSVGDGMAGKRVDVCLTAMFVLFVGTCRSCKMDPGTAFEALLSTFEARAASTHRGTLAIN